MQFNRDEHCGSKHTLSKRWVSHSTVALALATTLLAACQPVEEQAVMPEQTNVSTEEVAEDTNEYIGQIVTVRSEPIEKISPSTFTIEDEQFFGTESILVVNASGEPFIFPEEGVDIQVTGEVQNFVFADVENEYNLGLEEEAYVDYENQPALIAQSIAIAPEPGELTSNPEQYYNEPLAVTGEVEEIQGANAFTLDEEQLFGGQDLLVLHATPTGAAEPMFEDGETVAVTGELRPFVVADLERDYDFNWETGIEQQLEAEYSNRPVLVAEDIYPSAIPDSAQ